MVARKLLVVALAATLLIGGVAATGAASVQDAQPDNDTDADRGDAGPPDDSTEYDAGNDSAADRGNGSAADRGNGSAPADVGPDGEQGPPTDMPANVPDHVTQIHETINGFLSGDVDDLGNALSEFLGGDDADEDDAAENESGDAEEANDSDDDAEDANEADDAADAEEDDSDEDDEESADADDSDDEDADA